MSIPPRAQLRLFFFPGPRAIVGFALFIVLVATLTNMGYGKKLPEPMLLLLIFVALSSTWIGSYFDRKSRSRQLIKAFEGHGFVTLNRAELDPDYLQTARSMKPSSLKDSTIKSAVVGSYNDHEIIISEHIVGHGRYKQYFMSCAVWTPHEWPMTIIRQRVLIDRVRSTQDLGIEAFDKKREILSDDLNQIAPTLSILADWFHVEKPKAMTFKMMPPPGLTEQWIFDGHWIIHADRGRANPKTLLQMAEFLTAFVDELEDQHSQP